MNTIIYKKIESLLKTNKKIVIAVDGMCASGKTTLAQQIKENFGGTVIHADSFFLPPEMRSEERLNEPGGNFHRERFIDEVINNLNKERFEYGVFDCAVCEIARTEAVNEKRLVIIEGSYCMHPDLINAYDYKIFTVTSEETQLKRISKRNGATALAVFKSKWIPMENKYFDFFGTREKCDAVIYS